jgi:hypothetical protein
MATTALEKLRPAPNANAATWAARISACWRASVEAILEVGRLLIAAKEALPHGTFGDMVDSDLPFGQRTAQMLIAIAADQRLSNAKHAALLPPSWMTLYELTRLDDEELERRFADGSIHPDMLRRDVAPARAIEPPREPPPQLSIAPPAAAATPEATAAPEPSTPATPLLPSNARVVAPTRVEPPDSRDYAPTPPWATRALLKVALPELRVDLRHKVLSEPACGEGHIAEVLREVSDFVFATDIHGYGYSGQPCLDFLTSSNEANGTADWIITNPPFNKAEEFALKAFEMAKEGVAFFVRLQWLEGVGRYERLFNIAPPALVAIFSERVPLHMGRWEPDGDTMTAYCWVIWRKNNGPFATKTRLFWIPPGQRAALSLGDDVERFTAHPVARKDHVITPDLPEPERVPVTDADLDIPAFLRRPLDPKPAEQVK